MLKLLRKAAASLALGVGLAACSEQAVPVVEEAPPAIEFEHEEPQGEGAVLSGADQKSADLAGHTMPAIEIGECWTQDQHAALSALRDEAVIRLTDPAFKARAQRLASEYNKVWLSQPLGFKDSAVVADIVTQPSEPVSYTRAAILPSRRGAVTGFRRGRLVIRLNPALLKHWQSADPVERGCAVNTMAHEITHTLTRRTDKFFFAFTDTGVGREARATAPASYFSGNLALCSYLVDQGRIAEDDIGRCMKVWYRPEGFQAGRCTAFADGGPVEWR